MKGKVLILFFFFLSADFFFTSCCRCSKNDVFNTSIIGISVSGVDTVSSIISDSIIKRNIYRVWFELDFEHKKISQISEGSSGFLISSAFACKCDPDEYRPARAIKNFEIITNTPVWGFDAGDTIKSVGDVAVFFNKYSNQNQNDSAIGRYGFEDLLINLRVNFYKSYYIEFTNPIDTDEFIDFEYLITFTDNTKESFKPGRIKLIE